MDLHSQKQHPVVLPAMHSQIPQFPPQRRWSANGNSVRGLQSKRWLTAPHTCFYGPWNNQEQPRSVSRAPRNSRCSAGFMMSGEKIPLRIDSPRRIRVPLRTFLRTFLRFSHQRWASILPSSVPSVRFRTHLLRTTLSHRLPHSVLFYSKLIYQGILLRPFGTGVQAQTVTQSQRGRYRSLLFLAPHSTAVGAAALLPNTTQYFSCTGSQRSPLLDYLVFVSSSGDTASAVFPLWFPVSGSLPARESVHGQASGTTLAHSSAGDCRKRSRVSKGSSREKRLKRDTSCKFGFSLTGALRKGGSQPSEFAHLDDTVVDRGDTTSTPTVMSRSTGTRIPSTTRAPLAPLELRGDVGDGLRLSLPFSGQTGGVDTRSVSFFKVLCCVFLSRAQRGTASQVEHRVFAKCDSQSHGF